MRASERPGATLPLTPLRLLARARRSFPARTAWRHGGQAYTYSEFGDRAERLAAAIATAGVQPGDRVSVLSPNTELALLAHFSVPGIGAVLNMLNVRLTVDELGGIVDHCEPTLILADHDHVETAAALAERRGVPLIVHSDDADGEFESMLAAVTARPLAVDDELSLLAINYTSGTTGRPKGVMYSHRGAYLQSLAMVGHTGLGPNAVFLWTLPMFHCNGWCFPWAVTGAGAAHVGLRRPDPVSIWRAIAAESVTHFNAAPTVLSDLAFSDAAPTTPPDHVIRVATGGAPPSPALLARLSALSIEPTHLYGLTETYGPAVVCDWQSEWDALDIDTQSRLRARQGIANIVTDGLEVRSTDGTVAPHDGTTTGEIVVHGDNVMLGYYRDDDATAAAFTPDGWLRTGDIGVIHPDGYLEIRDRAKDVIISGGENIASVEVEHVLASHPAVLECAVVGMPDDRWGEVPAAIVQCHAGAEVDEAELIAYVRDRLAHFKAPKRVVFGPLPKTATGKVQKFVLREQLR